MNGTVCVYACMCAGDTVGDCICVHACMCGLCVCVYVGMCVNAGVWRPEAKFEFLGYYPLFFIRDSLAWSSAAALPVSEPPVSPGEFPDSTFPVLGLGLEALTSYPALTFLS